MNWHHRLRWNARVQYSIRVYNTRACVCVYYSCRLTRGPGYPYAATRWMKIYRARLSHFLSVNSRAQLSLRRMPTGKYTCIIIWYTMYTAAYVKHASNTYRDVETSRQCWRMRSRNAIRLQSTQIIIIIKGPVIASIILFLNNECSRNRKRAN